MFLLDSENNKSYSSVKDRLNHMMRVTEYAGYLEIICASFLLKTPIHIYENRGNNFKLLAKLPVNTYATRNPICIQYHMDLPDIASGHYNLLDRNQVSLFAMAILHRPLVTCLQQ